MDYTMPEVILFITAVCISLIGMGVALMAAWRTGAKVDQAKERVDAIGDKVDEVHTLTHRHFPEQKADMAALRAQLHAALESVVSAEIARQELAREAEQPRMHGRPPPHR